MEHVKCEICGADDYVVVGKRGLHGEKVNNVLCRKCGLVYVNPRMGEEDTAAFYRTQYKELYGSDKVPTDELMRRRDVHAAHRLEFLSRNAEIPGGGSVLEIGCGSGNFLGLLKQHDCQCFGIEPSLGDAEMARNRLGITVYTEVFEKVEFEENKFDLIALFQTLEHIMHPVDSLRRMGRLLKDDGILYIEVPNTYSNYRRLYFRPDHYFRSAHPFSFSMNTLNVMLVKAGFSVIARETQPQILQVLAKKDPSGNGDVSHLLPADDWGKKKAYFRTWWTTDWFRYQWRRLIHKTLTGLLGSNKAGKITSFIRTITRRH